MSGKNKKRQLRAGPDNSAKKAARIEEDSEEGPSSSPVVSIPVSPTIDFTTKTSSSPQKKKKNLHKSVAQKKPKQNLLKVTADDEDEKDAGDDDADDGMIPLISEPLGKKKGDISEFTFDFSDVSPSFYSGIQMLLTSRFYSTTVAHDITEIICAQGAHDNQNQNLPVQSKTNNNSRQYCYHFYRGSRHDRSL